MGAGKESLRVVLDTNVVLSALVFEHGRLSWLRQAWMQQRFIPILDKPCAQELLRALHYPKFKLSGDEVETLLGSYLPYTEAVDTAHAGAMRLPTPTDPDDRKFVRLAHIGRADFLVTGDRALLALAGKTRFVIEKPADFLHRLSK